MIVKRNEIERTFHGGASIGAVDNKTSLQFFQRRKTHKQRFFFLWNPRVLLTSVNPLKMGKRKKTPIEAPPWYVCYIVLLLTISISKSNLITFPILQKTFNVSNHTLSSFCNPKVSRFFKTHHSKSCFND